MNFEKRRETGRGDRSKAALLSLLVLTLLGCTGKTPQVEPLVCPTVAPAATPVVVVKTVEKIVYKPIPIDIRCFNNPWDEDYNPNSPEGFDEKMSADDLDCGNDWYRATGQKYSTGKPYPK